MTACRPDDAFFVDEVGIETAVHGAFRISTLHRPVFAAVDNGLAVVAVEALTGIDKAHGVMDVDAERDPSAGLIQALHLRNHRNAALPACDLFLDHHAGVSLESLLHAANEQATGLGAAPLRREQIVCRLRQVAEADLPRVAAQLHEGGFRIAIDLFDNPLGQGGLAAPRPDIAEINGAWLAKIAGAQAAAKLLRPLVEAHRAQGIRVFVGGISDAGLLQLALDAGADLLAGDHLALAAAVGCLIEERPLAGMLPRATPDATRRSA